MALDGNANRRRKRRLSGMLILVGTSVALLALGFTYIQLMLLGAFTTALVVLLLGSSLVIGVGIYEWHWETSQRAQRLIRNIKAAEKAKNDAEAALLEKSNLLATMSHEIRTPLNGAIGMMQLLLETPLSPEQKNYAKTAHASGRTLLSIIDEILDVAKAEARDGNDATVNIQALSESVTELLAPRAHAKGIEISNQVAPEILTSVVNLPELKLRQILFNLAGNAIKFTHQGDVEIAINAQQSDFHLTVKDSGIGMSPEELSRVFNEFEQAKQNTSRHYGGTGLGLAITKRIVEELGGKITAKSAVGLGTTFTIIIPNAVTQSTAATQDTPLKGRKFALGMNGCVNARHLAKSLEELGGDVSLLDEKGLQDFLSAAPNDRILISDSSRHEALRRWAKVAKRKKQKVGQVWTMLTAEERQSHQDMLTTPYTGYLLKPLRRSTLLNQLTAADQMIIENAVSNLRDIKRRTNQDQSLNILIAEDNAVNLLLLRTMLQKAGHHVEHVGDGKAFVTAATHRKFDIAILDVNMPVMNGFDAAKEWRAKHRHMPLIALTANASYADKQACYAAGFDGFVAKPFDQQDLIEAIHKLLKRKAA